MLVLKSTFLSLFRSPPRAALSLRRLPPTAPASTLSATGQLISMARRCVNWTR
uniref:Uncharacterized protein n=1 Tax=Myoviridae sp. ctuSi15 TaxID=2826708 RepID=A0A8S5MPN0_9CAUD|nr:MAG TPA: hypothetical protein [Myoviridae sp. ctuSi15]